ncbi:ABC transporter permease [Sphaerimonospora thailandensis]|uniref:ABC di/oligopeptide transporter inner membrane subunit n=1 Tax=Sphaerimonospora thailandensis TaxID=795644 RepID=A0A8J3R969_9ACTN|nr:ABC transporter permease [Sphaerimonospora thailandensis]GIH69672.1 ABC di/oligopeptide transporter inner membrane subunit [Sphaerimonospora thailandensis]
MRKVLAERLVSLPLVVLAMSAVIFGITYLVPGDAAESVAGVQADAAQVARLRQEMGLDAPLPSQYLSWLLDAVRGDLGRSLIDGAPVAGTIADRLPVTLSLTVAGAVVACLLGVPAGVMAGLRPRTLWDRAATTGASIGVAFPAFWLGLILVAIFSLRLGWLPATGYVPIDVDPAGWLGSIILPAVALGLTPAAALARQMRNSMAEVMGSDYVRTAHAKGMPRAQIVQRHALRNAAGPVVTQLGFWVAIMLGTSLIVEQVFSLPGIGGAMSNAIMQHDVPLLVGLALALVVIVVLVNLVVDLFLSALNPKTRQA